MYDKASSKICQKFTVLKINTPTLTVFIFIRHSPVLFCQPTWQFNCLYSNQEFDFPIACRKSRHSCFKQSVYHYMGHLKKNVHISVRMVLSGVSGRCITLTFEFWIEM